MDTRKDIQNTNMFLATRGVDSTNTIIAKKADRLATALYLVTSFVSDTDPMKARLRTLALALVERTTSVRYAVSAYTEMSVLDDVRANIGETMTLLELAFVAGLISEMNYSILKREYAILRDKIDLKKASRESRTDTVLSDTFFRVTDEPEKRVALAPAPKAVTDRERVAPPPAINKGHIAPEIYPAPKSAPTQNAVTSETSKKETKETQKVFHTEQKKEIPSLDINRDSRRTRIIKLIKDNKEVAIKDISNHFPDISEKTIQRELSALVDSGVLDKVGDRRWSRYMIKG